MVRRPGGAGGSPDIDLVVELIGGEDGPAKTMVEAALGAGKSGRHRQQGAARRAWPRARRGGRGSESARSPSRPSVAGGIPIVKTLREALAGNQIDARLRHPQRHLQLHPDAAWSARTRPSPNVLAEAQRLGYAEADPTFDIGGFDTAHKLAILTSLAFGTRIDAEAIHVEGIAAISLADIAAADELGFRIKLLGVAQRTADGVEQRVHPTMVRKTTPIAEVMGVLNAVTIDADAVHELTLVGPGAGGEATASAVVADIADIAKGVRSRAVRRARRRSSANCAARRRAAMRAAITSAFPSPTSRRGRGHSDAHGGARHLARKHHADMAARSRRARSRQGSAEASCRSSSSPMRRANIGPRGARRDLRRRRTSTRQRRSSASSANSAAPEGKPLPLTPIVDEQSIERFLALDLARVTERAAVAAARLRGRGDEKAADEAARRTMRAEIERLPDRGTRRHRRGRARRGADAFIGEKIGEGDGPQIDIAVDPLEGTTLCAKDMPGAIAVIAIAKPARCSTRPTSTWTKSPSAPAIRPASSTSTGARRKHRGAGRGQGRRRQRDHRLHPRPPAPRRTDRRVPPGRRQRCG